MPCMDQGNATDHIVWDIEIRLDWQMNLDAMREELGEDERAVELIDELTQRIEKSLDVLRLARMASEVVCPESE